MNLLRRSVPVFQWVLAVVLLAAAVVVGTIVVRELRAGTGGAAGSATAAVESPPPTSVPAGAVSLPVLLFDDERGMERITDVEYVSVPPDGAYRG